MLAEVISIGDEMTSGQRLDTNSQWISQQLSDLGVQTLFHTTVGDDLNSNIDVFRIAAKRANIVICSGGLGPTADDLTRDALSMAFDRPLELRSEAMAHIESLFAARKRAMPERNRVQAMFPAASRIIPNPHGTAPGIDLAVNTFRQDGSIQNCRFFALPGVPAEMKQMWSETVQDRLRNEMGIGSQRWFYDSIKVFGIGESDCEALLPDLIKRDRVPRVGITVHQATITLRIAILAKNEEEAADIAAPTKQEIQRALGELIFGSGEDELYHAVHEKLLKAGQTLSVIEFGDASIIGPWLASLDDRGTQCGMIASQRFRADSFLGASRELLQADHTLEIEQRTLEYRKETNSDWCLCLGPYPSPSTIHSMSGLPAFPFSMTVIGPDCPISTLHLQLGGHPDIILPRLGKTGLHHLYKHLSTHQATRLQ